MMTLDLEKFKRAAAIARKAKIMYDPNKFDQRYREPMSGQPSHTSAFARFIVELVMISFAWRASLFLSVLMLIIGAAIGKAIYAY